MKLKAYGTLQSNPEQFPTETENFLSLETSHVIELFSQRSDNKKIDIAGVNENDIIELQDEDGYIEITTLKELTLQAVPIQNRSNSLLKHEIILNDLASREISTRGGGLKKFFKKIKILGYQFRSLSLLIS